MTPIVYWIPVTREDADAELAPALEKLLRERGLLDFVSPRDMVPVKTHFGEEGTRGYVRPPCLAVLAAAVRRREGVPFLTETSTLYRGRRSHAVEHLELAREHGFTPEATGMHIVMADGLLGDEEVAVSIPGAHYQEVNIAAQIVKSQCLVLVSHFTGHIMSGFGAALKNLGMGCASRRGKLIQHSTARPSVKAKKCTACGECVRWCPQDAISIQGDHAVIDDSRCIGCGECLAVCRFHAVNFNWKETNTNLQEKIVEHAMGAVAGKTGRLLCLNFMTRITRDCDCMAGYDPIAPDLGVLISTDPVALDAASLDLFEESTGKSIRQLAYDIPSRAQLDHAKKLGFGSMEYELVKVKSEKR